MPRKERPTAFSRFLAGHPDERNRCLQTVQEDGLADDERVILEAAIRSLPLELSEVIRQRFLDGRTAEDIAQAIRTSRQTVHRRINQGLALLRKRLAPSLGE